jgi:hypothetical protein
MHPFGAGHALRDDCIASDCANRSRAVRVLPVTLDLFHSVILSIRQGYKGRTHLVSPGDGRRPRSPASLSTCGDEAEPRGVEENLMVGYAGMAQ